jgi:hypothetical protein
LSQCRSIRTARVFSPRSTSQASNGPATAPIAFWWKPIRSVTLSPPSSRPPGHDDSADDVAVPTGILRRRVDDDVRAERSGFCR